MDFPESRTQELRLEELEPTGQNTRQKRSTAENPEICSKCPQIFSRMSSGKCKWQAMERLEETVSSSVPRI